jgi:hypothetical protein
MDESSMSQRPLGQARCLGQRLKLCAHDVVREAGGKDELSLKQEIELESGRVN